MYYVVSGSQLYGPATLLDLKNWQAQGRILPTTQIKDDQGHEYVARAILYFPNDPNAPQYQNSSPSPFSPGPGPQTPVSPFGNSASPPYPLIPNNSGSNSSQTNNQGLSPFSTYPFQLKTTQNAGTAELVGSIILSLSGIFCLPGIGPVIGIILGYMAQAKGNRNARLAIYLGYGSLILSLAIFYLASKFHF